MSGQSPPGTGAHQRRPSATTPFSAGHYLNMLGSNDAKTPAAFIRTGKDSGSTLCRTCLRACERLDRPRVHRAPLFPATRKPDNRSQSSSSCFKEGYGQRGNIGLELLRGHGCLSGSRTTRPASTPYTLITYAPNVARLARLALLGSGLLASGLNSCIGGSSSAPPHPALLRVYG
jgi:hypothetical protein